MNLKETYRNKKILITCGPTWIPIDDTRIISNKSSGELGQIMAKDFAAVGADVTLLEGPVAQALEMPTINIIRFYFYDDFLRLLKKELKNSYDIIVHAAAVSDYKLKKPFQAKISSRKRQLKLDLVPTKKIITLIKKWNPEALLVGFKLESKMTQALAKKLSLELFEKSKCDLVIANTTTEKKYSGFILEPDTTILTHETTRRAISRSLRRAIQEVLA